MRRIVVVLAVFVSLGAAAAASPAAADFAGIPSVLHAGHALTAGTPDGVLDSPDGRFELSIFGGVLGLEEDETYPGGSGHVGEVWNADASHQRPRPGRSTLRMQRDGNLVLRAGDGHVNWASHTAGTGSNNYLQLLSSGNLVLRTASGRTVWSTHTTPILLVAGQRLESGKTMAYRYQHNQPVTRLTMTGGGDLALTFGKHRLWHSGTDARGAHLSMRRTGGLAIVTPAGRAVWHSPAFGRRTHLELSTGVFALTNTFAHHCWQRPSDPGPTHTLCT